MYKKTDEHEGAIKPERDKMHKLLKILILTITYFTFSFVAHANSIPKLPNISLEELTDQKYLTEFAKGKKDLTLINLADPKLVKAYLAVLKRNGITPASHPEFFATIEKIRKNHTDLLAKGQPLPDLKTRLAQFNSKKPGDIYSVQSVNATSDFTNVNATAYATTYMGSLLTVVTIEVLNEDGIPISRGNIIQEKDGRNVTIKSYSLVPTVDGNTKSTPNNPGGTPVTAVATFFVIAGDGTPIGPILSMSPAFSTPEEIVVTDPVSTNNTHTIIVCTQRASPTAANPSPCDYGPTGEANITFPLAGKIIYQTNIVTSPNDPFHPSPNATADIALVSQSTGGGCRANRLDSAIFFEQSTLSNGTVFSWNLPKAYFGADCGSNGGLLTLTMQIGMPTDAGMVPATISNAPGFVGDNVSTYKLDPIMLEFGCILQGTKITMADGTLRAIENVKENEKILGTNGKTFLVRSQTVGTDSDFVKIVDSGKNVVFTTPTHPVSTLNRGFLQASTLKAGDKIMTRNGATKIVTAQAEKRDPSTKVFNLTLANLDGSTLQNPEDAQFYAGSIAVGDNAMQGILSKRVLDAKMAYLK